MEESLIAGREMAEEGRRMETEGAKPAEETESAEGAESAAGAEETERTTGAEGTESVAGAEETERTGLPEKAKAGIPVKNAGENDEEPNGFLDFLKKSLRLKPVEAEGYSPLALAYIGDAVYEVLIRTRVMNAGSIQVNKMNKRACALVKAEAQARMLRLLEPELTDEERAVYKRGRNAKSLSMARHASMADYRTATGFEALIGYLYLSEQFTRMVELTALGLEKIGEFDV